MLAVTLLMSFGTSACAFNQSNGNLTLAKEGLGDPDPDKAWAAAGPFTIYEDTLICVRVRIDKNIIPDYDYARNKIDANYGPVIERHLEAKHGQLFRSQPEQGLRVFPYVPGNQFAPCKDEKNNIILQGEYIPRADGTPYKAIYRVKQGSKINIISYETNLNKQYTDGVMESVPLVNNIPLGIISDINRQSENFTRIVYQQD